VAVAGAAVTKGMLAATAGPRPDLVRVLVGQLAVLGATSGRLAGGAALTQSDLQMK